MCGILGITEENEALARKALSIFSYRGPDASVVSARSGVTFGHNRLSIIDLDARANQPMESADGKFSIVFNGEIYNYKELKRELEAKGRSFRTTSDTEVLLVGFQEWGMGMVERLRGMYAFAIHEREADRLTLVTDQSGMKPIFYSSIGEMFAFASELKGVLEMRREKGKMPEVDRNSLDLYWMLGYVPVSRTIYKDIFRMPRRAILTVDLESGKKEQLQYALPAPSANDAKTMQALLEQAVERHLVADVPVGLFFSGGTDSSLIASILAKQGASLEAFSVEIDKRPEDREYFEKIASTLRLKPHRYFFGVNEFDDVYPAVTARIDEPLYDSALFPTYFISREARKRVKVALSGDGGDEYFLGYPQIMRLSRIHDARLDGKMGLLDYLYVMTPRFRGKADLFARLFILAHRPISYYLAAVSPAKDFVTAREWRAAKRTLAEHGTTPTALDADFYLENDILRKTDLATMYNSLEGRLPLLDADVIASAEKMMRRRVPLREKKPLLKEILASYLSRDLVYRGKRGFGLDSHVFFAKSRYLKNDLVAAIDYLNKRDLLPPKALMPHEALIRRRSQMCWQVLSLYHALKNAGV